MYLLQPSTKKSKQRVQLMGSGTILREVIAAADLLEKDWGVAADIWSAPSFTLLARDGQDAERWNMLNPTAKTPRVPFVTQSLQANQGPVIAATDYMRTYAEQIRAFMPKDRSYKVLGTDGFGRSDTRAKLREFFEVNRYFVTVAALKALAEAGSIDVDVVAKAIQKYAIDPNKTNPVTL
jgi:pyruvate dehydrogenase E1 component